MAVYSTLDVARATGMTYRMVHYYLSSGHLSATIPPRGSGSNAGWSEKDLREAQAFAALLRSGISAKRIRSRGMSAICLDLEDTIEAVRGLLGIDYATAR